MTTVLLAHAFFLNNDPKQVQKMRPYPPLGTLYAASALRAHGYSVALFDAMLADSADEFSACLASQRPALVVLYEDQFHFLNKMCLQHVREAACRMSVMARTHGATVIAAGADVSDHPEVYFAHGVQYALLGEADHSLIELVEILSGRCTRAITTIAGLAMPDPVTPQGIRRTTARVPERQPDVFPVLAWDLLDVEPYRKAWRQAHGYFSLNMVSTRGCPFHCNWCAKPIWGQRYAMRSPASVAEEMALLKRTLAPDHLWFADDIFGLRPQWVAEFAYEVESRHASIPFTIQSRVDLMTEQAVMGLARAGCTEVWLGVESGSQKILIMKPYPPLGLMYISAYLRRAGFSVDLCDTTFAQRDALVATLRTGSGGVLGIYTNLMTRKPVLEITAVARANGWTVILGGPESANYPDEYLRRGADVVVIGEGEETLAELLPALAARGPHRLHGVPGTVFRDEDGQIVTNPARQQIADLDSLPWPDRQQIDVQQYIDVWRTHHGMGSVNLITARGCPYKCHWCSHAVFGFTHRRRNYLDCVNEVEHIRDTYKPDQVWYADDVFTIHRTWLRNFAAELKRRQIKMPFETVSRADRMMREDILATLAEMGCYRIWIGSESGSQRILDAMERGVTAEQVQWATRAAQRYGIEVGMFLMWGYEGEEIEDIEATIEHVKQCNPDIFFTTVAYPIMNTTYYHEVADRVQLTKDWAEASDRDYVIQGRHSRTYYKYADQWLRQEVAAFRLAATDPSAAAHKRQEAEQARRAMLTVATEVEA